MKRSRRTKTPPALRRLGKLQLGTRARVGLLKEMAALLKTSMAPSVVVGTLNRVYSDEGRIKTDPVAMMTHDWSLDLLNGLSLAQAAAPWLPREDVVMLEAAQNSADIAAALINHARILEAKVKMRGAIISGLSYPGVLLLALFGLLLLFGLRIFPEVAKIIPPEKWIGPAVALRYMGAFAQTYAVWAAAGIVLFLVGVVFALPRWVGRGRKVADKLPLFSIYRLYTGVGFLLSVAGLIQGGLPPLSAIDRLRKHANPYVRQRLQLIRSEMRNGSSFGDAVYKARTDWPDRKMNLSIKIFAQVQNLNEHMSALALDWVEGAVSKLNKQMGALKALFLILVALAVALVLLGMQSLQQQIGASVRH